MSAKDQLTVHPDCQALFAAHGLTTAAAVLALPGVVVNGHANRNVARIHLGDVTAYLKRELRIQRSHKMHSLRAGFGYVTLSEREAKVLRFLQDRRLCGPEWMAYGSADGEAFLLVRAAEGKEFLVPSEMFPVKAAGSADSHAATKLPPEVRARKKKAVEATAAAVAKIHQAGVDQPDLYAKHVLADAAGNIVMLDWQRARLRKSLTPALRVRSLAALCATAPASAGRSDRLRFLRTYLAAFGDKDWKPVARQILAETAKLMKRSGIRRQLGQDSEVNQLLIRIANEAVNAVPEAADALRAEAVINELHDPTRATPPTALPAGTVWKAGRYGMPLDRVWATLRGKTWRAAEMKLARLVMHLERYGVPAPKIVAYGQRSEGLSATAFVAYRETAPDLRPPQSPADWAAVRKVMDQIHSVGVVLRDIPATATPFGVADGRAVVRDPACFQLQKKPAAKHLARADQWLKAAGG